MGNPFLSSAGWFERGADNYLPFVGHIRADVGLKMDGSVFAILRLSGAPFALEDHAKRNSRLRVRNAILRNIADDTLTIVETMVRHEGVPHCRLAPIAAPSPRIWKPPTVAMSWPGRNGSTNGL
jgi:type IV secretion system protein VirB4